MKVPITISFIQVIHSPLSLSEKTSLTSFNKGGTEKNFMIDSEDRCTLPSRDNMCFSVNPHFWNLGEFHNCTGWFPCPARKLGTWVYRIHHALRTGKANLGNIARSEISGSYPKTQTRMFLRTRLASWFSLKPRVFPGHHYFLPLPTFYRGPLVWESSQSSSRHSLCHSPFFDLRLIEDPSSLKLVNLGNSDLTNGNQTCPSSR